MKEDMKTIIPDELNELCADIKKLIKNHQYAECSAIIQTAMKSYPHSPIPHNLLGILQRRKVTMLLP